MKELKKKYDGLPKAHKSELKSEFRKQFEYRTDSIFVKILEGTHFPTPIQDWWLKNKIDEYHNHAQGIAPVLD